MFKRDHSFAHCGMQSAETLVKLAVSCRCSTRPSAQLPAWSTCPTSTSCGAWSATHCGWPLWPWCAAWTLPPPSCCWRQARRSTGTWMIRCGVLVIVVLTRFPMVLKSLWVSLGEPRCLFFSLSAVLESLKKMAFLAMVVESLWELCKTSQQIICRRRIQRKKWETKWWIITGKYQPRN